MGEYLTVFKYVEHWADITAFYTATPEFITLYLLSSLIIWFYDMIISFIDSPDFGWVLII